MKGLTETLRRRGFFFTATFNPTVKSSLWLAPKLPHFACKKVVQTLSTASKIVRRSSGGRLLVHMAGDLSARQPTQPDANGAAKGNPNGICNRVSHLAAPVHEWLREFYEYAERNPVEGVFPKLLRLCKAHGEHE